MLTGLLQPTAGTAEVCGIRIADAALKGVAGVLPESLALFDALTIGEHLELTGAIYKLPSADVQSRTEQLLRILQLEHSRNTFIHQCSYGMKKKTALAMALLPNPRALFLDEPFEGLDPITARTIRSQLHALSRRGVTVLLTSHILPLVDRIADKVVIINHGSNVIGTVQPLKEIGALCREHDIIFVVDTAQTAGVIPIHMKEMNVDVVAFTGHKALMGSMGIGGLCIRKHVEVRQVRAGGTGVRSVEPYHLEEFPWRLEFGTPNMVGVAALWAGQDWLDENGVKHVYAHEMRLASKLVEGLRQVEGVKLYCCDSLENHLSTILMNVAGVDPGDVGIMLDVDHNIATRTGLHCAPLVHKQLGLVESHGGVRFSVGAFNTEADVEAAIHGVAEIARWARERAIKPVHVTPVAIRENEPIRIRA